MAVPPRLWRLGTKQLRLLAALHAAPEFTHQAHLEHEQAKAELKRLIPEEAKEVIGHGIRAKRSKSGAISFDLARESDYAAV